MKLLDGVHLVGSGSLGFGLTDDYDCHVYLLDGGDELALVDVGAGMGAEQIIEGFTKNSYMVFAGTVPRAKFAAVDSMALWRDQLLRTRAAILG